MAACAGPGLDARALTERARAESPRAVVLELYATAETAGGAWSQLLRGVAAGDPAFLELAVTLGPGTDAGATSELRDALFLALEPAPLVTLLSLRAAPPGPFTVEAVCGLGLVAEGGADRVQDLVMRRLGTVREVETADLSAERDRCLRALERALSADH